MRNARRWLLVLGMLVVGLVVAAPPAHAIVFDLTSDHCTGGCGTAPFGTVTLEQDGTTVDVTVDLADGYFFVKTGAADDQAFKFNGTGFVVGDITVDQNAPNPLSADAGALNGDGTGNFGFGIECLDVRRRRVGCIQHQYRIPRCRRDDRGSHRPEQSR